VAQRWALVGNIVIAFAYAAITMAIGAVTIMDVCERIENDARTLTNGTADDLRRLRLELERVERHLHELAPA
jgi:hypothetical protein